MSLQVTGFRWSLGIHTIFILALIALQFLPAPQKKIAVIDFDFSGTSASQQVERPVPVQGPPAARQLPVQAANRPGETTAPQILPATVPENVNPEAAGTEKPSQVSSAGEKTTGAFSSAAGDPETDASRPVQTARDREAGSGGTGPAASEESGAVYLKEHFAYIRDRIHRGISYPPLARKMGWCGRVRVAFIVGEDGGVGEVKILDSSGFRLLDRNAVETVRKVAPFPRPPVKAEIRMVISYLLR